MVLPNLTSATTMPVRPTRPHSSSRTKCDRPHQGDRPYVRQLAVARHAVLQCSRNNGLCEGHSQDGMLTSQAEERLLACTPQQVTTVECHLSDAVRDSRQGRSVICILHVLGSAASLTCSSSTNSHLCRASRSPMGSSTPNATNIKMACASSTLVGLSTCRPRARSDKNIEPTSYYSVQGVHMNCSFHALRLGNHAARPAYWPAAPSCWAANCCTVLHARRMACSLSTLYRLALDMLLSSTAYLCCLASDEVH